MIYLLLTFWKICDLSVCVYVGVRGCVRVRVCTCVWEGGMEIIYLVFIYFLFNCIFLNNLFLFGMYFSMNFLICLSGE